MLRYPWGLGSSGCESTSNKAKAFCSNPGGPIHTQGLANQILFFRNNSLLYSLQAELILPKELYEIIQYNLSKNVPNPSFSRVILPLSAILEGEFFNEYIKKGKYQYQRVAQSVPRFLTMTTGNISMLSEGQHGIDNVFSLREGNMRFFTTRRQCPSLKLPQVH